MRLLGIDPGLITTGYGIIEAEGNHLRFIHAGYITTSSRQSLEIRLKKIHAGITQLIQEYELDAVILEKLYAHYKHPVTACLLGHARGVICLACAQNKVELFEYAATRMKKAISGKGHATKLQIQHMIHQLLNISTTGKTPLDVTDALSLAIAHSYITRANQFKQL